MRAYDVIARSENSMQNRRLNEIIFKFHMKEHLLILYQSHLIPFLFKLSSPHFDNHIAMICNATFFEKLEFVRLDPQNPRSRELNLNKILSYELNLNTH